MQSEVVLPKHVPIAYSTRGNYVENVFYGSVAVVDRDGKLIAHVGDVDYPIFTRSALKPLQALPLVANPRFAEYGLTPAEIALLCSSHNGEPVHAETAGRLLAKVGLTEAALQCGSHTPYWYQWNNERPDPDKRWSPLFHNCSGKHSGFLTVTQHLKAGPEYVEIDHPLQKAVRAATEEVTGETVAGWGVDGCSATSASSSTGRSNVRCASWSTPIASRMSMRTCSTK